MAVPNDERLGDDILRLLQKRAEVDDAIGVRRNTEIVQTRGRDPVLWKWQPDILFADRNDLTKQDQLSTIMLASIIARLGGVVQFVDRELESCNLTLDFERINVDGVAMHMVSTRYPLPNPIDKLNAFADRWEQRAATLPPDAAGELIDMAAELRHVAGRLFE
jgi:hypothetical protein